MATKKEIVISFLQMVVSGKIDEAYQKYISKNLVHHNGFFPSNPESLKQGMKESHEKFPNKITEIKHAVEENDIVVTHSHLRFSESDPGMGVVHIFRFEDGRIAEMWDLGQAVPKDSPNKNGMF